MNAVNWSANAWFAKHYGHKAPEEFKAFWLEYYGPPSDYSEDGGEQDEYWRRCGFCLIGWLGATASAKTSNVGAKLETTAPAQN